MTELLLIRHALPVSGVQTPGLSEEGVEQALRLGSWLKGEDVDVLVTSPMRRAVETARIVAEQMGRGVDVTVDDLREWDTDLPPTTYVPVEEMGPLDPRAVAMAEGRYDDFVLQLDREAFRARGRRRRRRVVHAVAVQPGRGGVPRRHAQRGDRRRAKHADPVLGQPGLHVLLAAAADARRSHRCGVGQ